MQQTNIYLIAAQNHALSSTTHISNVYSIYNYYINNYDSIHIWYIYIIYIWHMYVHESILPEGSFMEAKSSWRTVFNSPLTWCGHRGWSSIHFLGGAKRRSSISVLLSYRKVSVYVYIQSHNIYIYSVNKQAIIKEFLFNKWVSLQKIWNLQTCPNLVLVWCFDVLMFGEKPAFFFIFLGVSIRNSSKPGCRIHIHTHRYYRYRKAA